jgi:hypothetical protein
MIREKVFCHPERRISCLSFTSTLEQNLEMFESMASFFAFHCSTSLNMRHPVFPSCQNPFHASV